jgi:16S rRNA processing protein RimM
VVDQASALVPLGVVIGAHGVRGELRVKLLNPASDLLASVAYVWLRGQGAACRVGVRSVHEHRQALLLVAIDGCADRDAAEALRGSELCVPRAELPQLEEGEYYLIDLVGLEVHLPSGEWIGCVEGTLEYPASQVLRVRLRPGHDRGVAEAVMEVPLLEPYLVAIEPQQRGVVVDHLDDLEVEAPARTRGS